MASSGQNQAELDPNLADVHQHWPDVDHSGSTLATLGPTSTKLGTYSATCGKGADQIGAMPNPCPNSSHCCLLRPSSNLAKYDFGQRRFRPTFPEPDQIGPTPTKLWTKLFTCALPGPDQNVHRSKLVGALGSGSANPALWEIPHPLPPGDPVRLQIRRPRRASRTSSVVFGGPARIRPRDPPDLFKAAR